MIIYNITFIIHRFEQAVRKNVYEERQNQLRWQVKLGDEPMVVQDKAKVVSERQHCWALYQVIMASSIIVSGYRLSCQACYGGSNHTPLLATRLAKKGLSSCELKVCQSCL